MDINMIVPDSCHEVVVPVSAGIIVSLLNRFILNNPNFTMCSDSSCNQHVEEIEVDEDMSDAKSGSSGAISSTLEIPHSTTHVHTH